MHYDKLTKEMDRMTTGVIDMLAHGGERTRADTGRLRADSFHNGRCMRWEANQE